MYTKILVEVEEHATTLDMDARVKTSHLFFKKNPTFRVMVRVTKALR